MYQQAKATEAQRVGAQVECYARQKAIDAELCAKCKEAEGLKVLARHKESISALC